MPLLYYDSPLKVNFFLDPFSFLFPSVPETVITQVHALRSPVELDALFEKSLTAESIEELPWQDPEA